MKNRLGWLAAVLGMALLAGMGLVRAASADDISLWTRQLGTATDDEAYGVAADTNGNVYAAGSTQGGLDGNASAGGTDMFVVKYDPSGAKQWTRQLGTAAEDAANGVAVDASGNVYAAGYTGGGLDGYTNAGSFDLFVVKYDTYGVKQWTRQMGTQGGDVANGVTVDTSGNIYVAGATSGGLDGNTNAGNADLFVIKFNSSGVKQWTRQMGSAADDFASGVAVDTNGNVYVAGYTSGGLDGNTNAGNNDLFLVKYNSSGVKQWTRQMGTADDDEARGVAVDTSGNAYVTGWTGGGLDGNTYAGGYDLFVMKYNSSGVKQWTRQMGTGGVDWANGVTADTSGNVYVTGLTQGGLDGNTNAGADDFIVVKYNSSGVKQWTKQMGTAGEDAATSIAGDGNGNLYVAGKTSGGFDGNTNAGGWDVFVMRLAQQVVSATLTASSSPAYTGNTVTFTATATGGFGSPEYLYWLYGPGTGNTWAQKTAYPSSSTWSWTPSTADAGANYVLVFVRASGSSATYEAYAMCSLTVVATVASKSAALTPVSASTTVGAITSWTASASGGSGPYVYSFWLYGPGTGNTWVKKADYSPYNIWYWTPASSDIGTSTICVWVKNSGSPASYETAAFSSVKVSAAVPPTAAKLTPASASTTAGAITSWTASASGGSGPYEYTFWLYGPGTGNKWVQKASYTTANIWYLTPASSDTGANYVMVWVRNVGSSASYEAYATSWLTVQ